MEAKRERTLNFHGIVTNLSLIATFILNVNKIVSSDTEKMDAYVKGNIAISNII